MFELICSLFALFHKVEQMVQKINYSDKSKWEVFDEHLQIPSEALHREWRRVFDELLEMRAQLSRCDIRNEPMRKMYLRWELDQECSLMESTLMYARFPEWRYLDQMDQAEERMLRWRGKRLAS